MTAKPAPQPLCQGLDGNEPCANYDKGNCGRLLTVLDLHGPEAIITDCGLYSPIPPEATTAKPSGKNAADTKE